MKLAKKGEVSFWVIAMLIAVFVFLTQVLFAGDIFRTTSSTLSPLEHKLMCESMQVRYDLSEVSMCKVEIGLNSGGCEGSYCCDVNPNDKIPELDGQGEGSDDDFQGCCVIDEIACERIKAGEEYPE